MFDLEIKCAKCGAIMTASVDREFTEAEKASLANKECGICYLKGLLERDLQEFEMVH